MRHPVRALGRFPICIRNAGENEDSHESDSQGTRDGDATPSPGGGAARVMHQTRYGEAVSPAAASSGPPAPRVLRCVRVCRQPPKKTVEATQSRIRPVVSILRSGRRSKMARCARFRGEKRKLVTPRLSLRSSTYTQATPIGPRYQATTNTCDIFPPSAHDLHFLGNYHFFLFTQEAFQKEACVVYAHSC